MVIIRVNTLSITINSFVKFSKMATSSTMTNGNQSATLNNITTVIHVNDHEISNEDATWQTYTGGTDEQQQPATFWTRINRLVKIAFGYSSNTAGVSGVAIPDPYNV